MKNRRFSGLDWFVLTCQSPFFHWNSPFSHGINLKSDKLNKKTEIFQTNLVGFLVWTHDLASQFWTETFWSQLYTVWYLNLNNYLVLQCILYEIFWNRWIRNCGSFYFSVLCEKTEDWIVCDVGQFWKFENFLRFFHFFSDFFLRFYFLTLRFLFYVKSIIDLTWRRIMFRQYHPWQTYMKKRLN